MLSLVFRLLRKIANEMRRKSSSFSCCWQSCFISRENVNQIVDGDIFYHGRQICFIIKNQLAPSLVDEELFLFGSLWVEDCVTPIQIVIYCAMCAKWRVNQCATFAWSLNVRCSVVIKTWLLSRNLDRQIINVTLCISGNGTVNWYCFSLKMFSFYPWRISSA